MWPFGKKKKKEEQAEQKPVAISAQKKPENNTEKYRMECAADVGTGEALPVFTILMNDDTWERKPTQICRPLLTKIDLPGIPLVALVHLIYQQGSNAPSRAYIRQERVDQIGKTVKEYEEEALHNTSVRKASWKIMSPGDDAKIAICNDDYLAAERILDPTFLRQAHSQLGANAMMVGIPARGQLYATPLAHFTAGDTHAVTFKMLMEKTFQDAGEIGISPGLFIVNDGACNTMAEFG